MRTLRNIIRQAVLAAQPAPQPDRLQRHSNMIDLSLRSTALRLAALLLSATAVDARVARADETTEPEVVASATTLVAPDVPTAPRADVAPAPAIVAEALYLRDDLPPGSRDLNFSVDFAEGEPDEAGKTSIESSPRFQLAMPLGERVGFTADVGFNSGGNALDAPGASLKVLLRAPDAGKTGLAASADLFGSSHSFDESEAGLGIGAIRGFGRVAFRAAVGFASGISAWSPHMHGGVSAAVALGSRWTLLGEVVAEGQGGEIALGTGPTVKMTLGESTALMAGALLQVEPAASVPTFTVQLTQSL